MEGGQGLVKFDMKETGRAIVYRRPEPFRYCSSRAFDSKWGMPVSSSADATEDRTTWGTAAAFAASTAAAPRRASLDVSTEKSSPNGVVTMKKPSAPRRAA